MSARMVPGRSSIGNRSGDSLGSSSEGRVFRRAPGSPGDSNGPQNANTEPDFPGGTPAGAGESQIAPAGTPDAHGFLTAFGSFDSHAVTLSDGKRNPRPLAGQPYQRIRWPEIRELVERPARREKEEAQLVILSTYAGSEGRTHEVQRERGWFGGLAVDIDSGNPSRADVVAALRAAVGDVAAEVYSSSSAEAGNRKWRILIPLARLIPGADYSDTQAALFALLEREGLTCDHTLARTAQVAYLPNVASKRRGADGRPLFYEFEHVAGELLDVEASGAIVAERTALRARREEEARAAALAAVRDREQRAARAAALGDNFDPVDHFNDTYSVEETLQRYGFERKPTGRGSHWKSPLSSSGSYSTEDRGGYWVAVSAWAKNHRIGREGQSGFWGGSAWDLYVGFTHAGDLAAAVEAYAEEARPGWLDRIAAVEHDGDRAAAVAAYVDLVRHGRRPRKSLQTVAPVRVEEYQTSRDPVSLEEWRRELEASVALEADRAGVKLLRGEPGCGKTYAVARAMAGRSGGLEPKARGVVSAPGHEFCGELVEELQGMGLDAAAYPKLDATTCGHFDVAERALAAGLPVTACVCSSCPVKAQCRETGYLAQVKEAEKAAHKVVTHERLARSAERLTRDAEYVTVEEDPSKLLRPSVSTTARQLERLAALADELGEARERSRVLDGLYAVPSKQPAPVAAFDEFAAWEPAGEDGPEEGSTGLSFDVRPGFFERVCEVARDLARQCRQAVKNGTPAGVHELELPAAGDVPKNPEGVVWAALQDLDRAAEGGVPLIPREALTLALHALTGRLERLYLQVDEDKRPGRERSRIVHAVGFWKTELPWDRVPVWINDGTGDVETLEQLTGAEVVDVTPGGDLELVQRAEQFPVDILPTTSTAKVGRILAGIVRAHPEAERVGVVMLKRHRDELLFPEDGIPRLPADVLERVAFSTHYGSGEDRGSNEFHRSCDLVVVLGTFRPPPSEVRRALIRRGQLEAANAESKWGTVERRAAGPSGELVSYGGRGYAERTWAAAADGLTRAAVRQAVGRARAICGDGVPVVLCSTENAGLPVRPAAELPMLDERADRVLEVVARLTSSEPQKLPPAGGSNCAQKPYICHIDFLGAVGPDEPAAPGVPLKALSGALPGVPEATVRKWVDRAVRSGELVREGSTTATRYRLPVAPGSSPSRPPAPAAVAVVKRPPSPPPEPSPPAPPKSGPVWLAEELEPARHPVTLSDVRWLHDHACETLEAWPAWDEHVTPTLVRHLHRLAVEAAEARGQPPPPIEVVAGHTVGWHAVTVGAA